jgi:hypothetical protein
MPARRRACGVRIKRSSRRATCPNKLTGAAATPSASSLARSRISRTTEGTSSLVQSAATGDDQSSRQAARSEALSPFSGGGGVRGASESAWAPRLRRLSVPVGGRRCDTGANFSHGVHTEQQSRRFPATERGAPPPTKESDLWCGRGAPPGLLDWRCSPGCHAQSCGVCSRCRARGADSKSLTYWITDLTGTTTLEGG